MAEFDAIAAQATRLGKLHMPQGVGQLALLRMRGEERLDDLFCFHIEAFAPSRQADFDSGLGGNVTVEINTLRHGARYFDGLLTEAEFLGLQDQGYGFRLTIRPWFWLASQRRNQRIFHNMTAPQILAEVLGEYADAGTFEDKLGARYPEREYTVQYRETDLNFCRRIMEEEGISFHFTHKLGAHVMVLTDDVETLDYLPGKMRSVKQVGEYHRSDKEHFIEWNPGRRLTTGRVTLTDYNFKSPNAAMETSHPGDGRHKHNRLEGYDYPGGYPDQGRGRTVVKLRMNADRRPDQHHTARGDVLSLGAGMRLQISEHPDKALAGKDFLCLAVRHDYTSEDYSSGGETEREAYECEAEFMPADLPYVAPMVTPWALVQGPQTARVVGEGEIDCDEYGRILVRFHWDRADSWSMRCRVAQIWAGQGWGGMAIPRIGMEVVVEFLEGDPDKPLVTGCVYNGANPVPYSLPAEKTKMTIKSQTHQGSGYNEFRFEDQAGEEEVFMHAQKDHNTIIENDESHSIGHDRSKTVGNDQSESIGNDKTIAVGHNHTESIGNDMFYTVGRNQQENYGKDHIHNVGNILKQAIFADHLYEAGRNYEGLVAGKYTLDVAQSITNNTKTHTLMAFQKMQIKGPGGKITIDASGITLEAAQIRLKGNVSMGGGGSAQVPVLQMAANEALPLCEECVKQKDD